MQTKIKRTYSPFQKGELAYKAGCTIHDYPEELSETAREEWRNGWRAKEQEARQKLYNNDLKFQHNEMGDIG
jgi:hypothetical protein